MTFLRSALLVAGLMLGMPCLAVTIRCDNCTEATYESRAAAPGTGHGVKYVYDVPRGIARKFQVGLQCDDNLNDGRPRCIRVASPLPVEADVEAFALELAAYYQETGGTMKSHFTFVATPPIDGLSAFDVVGPGGPQTQLFEWLWADDSWSNFLPALGAAVHQVSSIVASMWNDSLGSTRVTVVFTDGSRVTLSFEMINRTVEVVPGSAQDEFGNVIPATSDDLDGTRFDYTADTDGEAQQRMLDYLSQFGIFLPGSGRKWSCVKVGESEWDCNWY